MIITDDQVTTNQQNAAKLGVTIPGVGGGTSSGGTSTQNADGTAITPPATPVVPPATSTTDTSGTETTPPVTQINRPVAQPGDTTGETAAANYLDNFQAPETTDQIMARKTAEAGQRIQDNKDLYAGMLSDQDSANDVATRETNARNVINGLSGSSSASSAAVDTANTNAAKLKTIKAEGATSLDAIYKDIQDSADTEAEAQKTDATNGATAILARKDANRTKAVTDITTLAKSGFDFDSIKANDPTTYQHLADSVGGEDQLNAIAVLNRPQDTILDKSVQDGKYVIAYQNPLTGKVTIQSTDLGLPPGYKQVGDAGDRLLFAPTNWDGDSSKVISVAKGAPPKTDTETQTDKKTAGLARITQAFNNPAGGIQTINPVTGNATYEAWNNIINEAPTLGLTRQDVISNFGYLIINPDTGKIDPEYKLSPKEEQSILGAPSASQTLLDSLGS